MAIWFIEGFDHYSLWPYAVPPATSTADLLRKWTTVNVAAEVGPGYARQQPGQGAKLTNTQSLYKARPGALTDTGIAGFAFQVSANNVATVLVSFIDTGSLQCEVRIDSSGRITFTRNGTVLATSTNTLSPNTWYYLEAKAKVHNSTGTYEVRINGSATNWIPAATGANTRSTANNQITGIMLGQVTNMNHYFDDLYFADATGTANTDFLGPQTVIALRPAAAGNYAQFTPNYGNNFGNLTKTMPDGDASFNASVTADHRDSFLLGDVPFAAGTIAAIQHVIYAKQDAGAQRVLKPMQRTSTTNRDGTAINLSTSYTYSLEVMQVNPADDAAYAIADLNADEFGYTLVS